MTIYTHSIPIGNGEPMHSASGWCWCRPTRCPHNKALWTHHSNHCRAIACREWHEGEPSPEDPVWAKIAEGHGS